MFPKDSRILLVDDSKTTRDLLKGILRDLQLNQVQTAEDGSVAVELIMAAEARNEPFDLIISDWKMPEMDGLQLLNFVRKSTQNNRVPFLIVTAEGENANVVAAVQAGANGYMLKPFTPKLVAERLQKISSLKR